MCYGNMTRTLVFFVRSLDADVLLLTLSHNAVNMRGIRKVFRKLFYFILNTSFSSTYFVIS